MLDFQQRLLPSKSKLYMRAGLNRAQADTGSMFGVMKDTRTRITGDRATGAEEKKGPQP